MGAGWGGITDFWGRTVFLTLFCTFCLLKNIEQYWLNGFLEADIFAVVSPVLLFLRLASISLANKLLKADILAILDEKIR